MKIAQVTNFFWPKKYGSNELFLCRELVKRGHEVTVLTAQEPSKEYRMLAESVPRRQFFEGICIERFPSVLNFGNILLMPSLLPFLVRSDFDLIHTHEFFTPCSFYSAIASRANRIPLLMTQHNDQLPQSAADRFQYYANASTCGRYTLVQARKIIALSASIKDHLLMLHVNREKIEVIPNGVDTEKFAPSKSNWLEKNWGITQRVVLFVGRFIEPKGIIYLLEAFMNVIEKVPDAKLVFVGAGPQRSEIARFQNKCKDHIFCIDLVNHTEMPHIYAGCDVLVNPCFEERFGNTVLEAMASGKPVIGAFVYGMKDIIVNGVTGFHVQPKNTEQISDSLLKILTDDALRKRLGGNARRRAVEKYSHKVLVRRVEKLYSEVLRA